MFVSFHILLLCLNYGELLACVSTSADYISQHQYPVEIHNVTTEDGYVLTMFRIPYSPRGSYDHRKRPIVFLMHGMTLSSDSFLLNGPNSGLPYLLADAGYDVWLGNARGNRYSRKHIHLSPNDKDFWKFSWHEIGTKDMPAQIDYVLYQTYHYGLHYIGHSQGTTVFLVMLSVRPEYNTKIKTSHMLSPVAFFRHTSSQLMKYGGLFFTTFVPDGEFVPHSELMGYLKKWVCSHHIANEACNNLFYLMSGGPSIHTNKSMINMLVESTPAGVSSLQMKHYLQLYKSGRFRAYDFGKANWYYYGTSDPPQYYLNHINPRGPVYLYYSDNDVFSAVQDVDHLAAHLPNRVLHHVKWPQWNHMDFIYGNEVKEVINDVIINICNKYEYSHS